MTTYSTDHLPITGQSITCTDCNFLLLFLQGKQTRKYCTSLPRQGINEKHIRLFFPATISEISSLWKYLLVGWLSCFSDWVRPGEQCGGGWVVLMSQWVVYTNWCLVTLDVSNCLGNCSLRAGKYYFAAILKKKSVKCKQTQNAVT